MTRRARRCRIAGAALAAALPLTACHHFSLATAVSPAVEPAAMAPAAPAPPPSDPVLAFVAAASPGQTRSLEDPALGRVQITLEREYYSADGVICRRFTLAVRDDVQTRVACRQPDGWRLDAILGQRLSR